MPATRNNLEIRTGIATAIGGRTRNEDFAAAAQPSDPERSEAGLLAAVADGIGGARGGAEAARLAVEGFIAEYYRNAARIGPEAAARRALAAVNSRIFETARGNPALRGMGTTLSVLILAGVQAHTVHVGDSRICLLRENRLWRLTEDHNLHELGLPHVLTRAVGTNPEVEPDIAVHEARPGDRFLLCSDGVSGVLHEEDIAAHLRAGLPPKETAQRIVEAAMEAGGFDNATAVVVELEPVAPRGEALDRFQKPRVGVISRRARGPEERR